MRQIGIQSSVMGWNDPWHEKLCNVLMRTGEGRHFQSQDPTPTGEQFISWIRELGADFYLHHVMPDDSEIASFIDDMMQFGMPFLIGNEYGNINGAVTDGTNRYDLPLHLVEKARQTELFMGLLYDESAHLQFHPDMYASKWTNKPEKAVHQWADPSGCTLSDIENKVALSVQKQIECAGVPMYTEHVFPSLYHTYARGGIRPCPKLLKEEFQSLQLSSAMGAAKQYKRKMGICVDLWGMDVGNWFTRIWGFPGHSPEEYRSALRLAWATGAEFLFTENADILGRFDGSKFINSEFGEILKEFSLDWVKSHPLSYDSSDVTADILLIRSDDGILTENGNFAGRGAYGSTEISTTEHMASAFHTFHLLSRGTLPSNGSTWFLPQFKFPNGSFARNEETFAQLPLLNGVSAPYGHQHGLFYPMNNVLVYDEKCDLSDVQPKLIVLAGSRMTDVCLSGVQRKVDQGAHCLCASWLLPTGFKPGRGWLVVDSLLSDEAKAFVEPYLGDPTVWTMRFGKQQLHITKEDELGQHLHFEWR